MLSEMAAKFINEISHDAHTNAINHGFYEDIAELIEYLSVNDQPRLVKIAQRNFVLAQLAKIASEIGEAVAAIQHDEFMEHLPEELADISIRTYDLADFLGYHHGFDVVAKMEHNRNRPRMHGKTC